MEFFKVIDVKTSEDGIKDNLSFENLELMSNQLFFIGNQIDNNAEIGSVWGEFTLNRIEIKGGLRFALLECPNALAWTITTGYPPSKNSIIIHLTINRIRKNQEFINEIEDFLNDMLMCLPNLFK